LHSRPMPFQQRTNTSCYLAIPTHGFTVVLSVFRGTPPMEPLNCKIRFLISVNAIDRSWAHHTGDQPMLVVAKFNLSICDITWMSLYVCSRSLVPFVNCHSIFSFPREIKNPAYFRKQGWKKSLSSFRTCLHRVYPNNHQASAQ
jgi:hypothetical protein